MERIKVMCSKCSGRGFINQRFIPCGDGMTIRVECDTCAECNGKGYTEYAVFSVEEAEAILKHCGLSTKS